MSGTLFDFGRGVGEKEMRKLRLKYGLFMYPCIKAAPYQGALNALNGGGNQYFSPKLRQIRIKAVYSHPEIQL